MEIVEAIKYEHDVTHYLSIIYLSLSLYLSNDSSFYNTLDHHPTPPSSISPRSSLPQSHTLPFLSPCSLSFSLSLSLSLSLLYSHSQLTPPLFFIFSFHWSLLYHDSDYASTGRHWLGIWALRLNAHVQCQHCSSFWISLRQHSGVKGSGLVWFFFLFFSSLSHTLTHFLSLSLSFILILLFQPLSPFFLPYW